MRRPGSVAPHQPVTAVPVPVRALRLALYFLAAAIAYGTAQTPDILLFEGTEHPLFENPLESAFDEARNPRPESLDHEGVQSTGNWRGYVATWELEGEHLYLRKIE